MMLNLGLFFFVIFTNSFAVSTHQTFTNRKLLEKQSKSKDEPTDEFLKMQKESAKRGEFPHQVSLRYTETKLHYCGGAILNESFVLTAAHCVYQADVNKKMKEKELFVVVGQNDLALQNNSVKRDVKKIIRHPAFRPYRLVHDLALLELAQKLPAFTATVLIKPVKLNDKETVLDNTKCTVSGWGEITTMFKKKRKRRKTSTTLKKEDIKLVSFNSCRTNRTSLMLFHFVAEGSFCAETSEKVDKTKPLQRICTVADDSGGPLLCNGALTGLVSVGTDCSKRERPSIYTNIGRHLSWIKYQRSDPRDFIDESSNFGRKSRGRKAKRGSASKHFCNYYLYVLIVVAIKF